MKTAISIPDEIFAEAERLARRQKKSRSQLYAKAVAEYVARHDPDAVTEAMDRVCEDVGPEPDPAVSAAARRALERNGIDRLDLDRRAACADDQQVSGRVWVHSRIDDLEPDRADGEAG